jgi:ribA/ribD-fused uncharacterized protein
LLIFYKDGRFFSLNYEEGMSSLAGFSLRSVLEPFRGDYNALFSPRGGYLVAVDGGGWRVQKLRPSDVSKHYDLLVGKLLEDKEYREVKKPVELIKRINGYFTDITGHSVFSSREAILFNSKIASYSYLSNFYPTLLLCSDPLDRSTIRLYPSSENAYQASKICMLASEIDRDEVSAAVERISVVSEHEAKRLGAEFYIPPSNEVCQKKSSIMKDLNRLKFEQNLPLLELLIQTNPKHLIEESGDRFWGASSPVDYKSLEKSYSEPISLSSQNCLGRVLMEVRTELVEKYRITKRK